jgi:hypothetical protein
VRTGLALKQQVQSSSLPSLRREPRSNLCDCKGEELYDWKVDALPASEYVDDAWEKVAVGTAERQLGIAAKVSTADEEIGKERKLT